MIQKSYIRASISGENSLVFDEYEYLSRLYPEIECKKGAVLDTTHLLNVEAHYNELQKAYYIDLVSSLGDKESEFYENYKPTPNECWKTCYHFCLIDPKRYKMVEGHYDGLRSLYHWVVKDLVSDEYIDVHFDLVGTCIESFTPKREMTTKEYDQQFIDQKKEEKRKEKEFQEMLKKIRLSEK